MGKNFKKYFFLILILLMPIFLIQQWSKNASHYFKDLGYKVEELVTVNDTILVTIMDTVQVPKFSFLKDINNTLTNKDLLGSNYIIQFFFTACPTICPTSTINIRNEIHNKFINVEDFKILSISIAEDSSQKMSDYCENYNIESPNWIFLTGSRNQAWSFATELSLSAGFGSKEDGGFFHSPFIVLVDKEGFIRTGIDKQKNIKTVWDATSFSDMELLSEDISQLFFNENKPLKE
jgi:protein SCO1/2